MTGPWELRVYDRQRLVHSVEFAGPMELGRQSEGEEGPYAQRRESGRCRLIVARLHEDGVSRKHALLEPLPNGSVRLTNLSSNSPVHLSDAELAPGASAEVPLPAVLTLGNKTVRVQAVEAEDLQLQGLAEATRAPGDLPLASRLLTLGAPSDGQMHSQALIGWLQAAMGVLQSAASSLDFFPRAAQALVDLVGLDSGRVLLLEQGGWKTAGMHSATPSDSSREAAERLNSGEFSYAPPSQQVLGKVCQEKRTFWQTPGHNSEAAGATAAAAASLAGVKAVVAAPILNRQSEIIGVLYGDRRHEGPASSPPITELQAMLVELLAGGVAAGLARLEQEQAALAARVRLEQFFTPELARQLAARPDLLTGRDCDVTILLCDVRGFSRISERLGPAGTVEWINDVLQALSDCVLANRGVLVDYIGDDVMAMWGAPEEQPDHAQLACRAAVAMLDQLPQLNARWQAVLKEPVRLGIGISSGLARVGNIRSQHKLKYGPLGNTVNLASRIQGATKYLRTNILMAEETQARLGPSFRTRRLFTVRVVNIAEPIRLYELLTDDRPDWADLKHEYEKALAEFEKQDFDAAARTLTNLRSRFHDDGPALVLLARAVNCLADPPRDFDPVWQLPGK